MPQIGSDRGLSSGIVSGLMDATGENVVSTSIDFGASPLGIAARTQALYGLANSNFTLTPPDPTSRLLDGENPLPFWSVLEDSDGRITATSDYDTTTGTWGVIVDPSSATAITSDTLTMKTRSYVISDDNLSVRQKAFLQMAKSGTAGTATQWNLTLKAEYFNAAGSSLSSYTIGTALDTASFTTINGFTMSGGSAIPASSQYVDLTVTCTATGTVTGTAKATLKSLLIQTSQPSTGSFTVVETFTSDGTWTRPTGVQYISAIVGGAGGGGGGGGLKIGDVGFGSGGGGGGGGAWVFARDFYVGDQTSITIGIGAAGAGGSGRTAGTAVNQTLSGSAGASGGASTLGSFIVAGGGSGGSGGTAASAGTVVISGVSGGAAGTVNCAIFGAAIGTPSGGSSGQHNAGTTSVSDGSAGVNSYPGVTLFPFYPILSASTQGAAGTVLGTGGGAGTGTNGAVSTGAAGGGGGGGCARNGTTNNSTVVSAGGPAVGGSGPGGGGAARRSGGTVLISGAGGSAAPYSSGGGGGGGGGAIDIQGTSSGSFKSADGGPGAKGLVIISYTA